MACSKRVASLDLTHAKPAFLLPTRCFHKDPAIYGGRGSVRLVPGGHAGT